MKISRLPSAPCRLMTSQYLCELTKVICICDKKGALHHLHLSHGLCFIEYNLMMGTVYHEWSHEPVATSSGPHSQV